MTVTVDFQERFFYTRIWWPDCWRLKIRTPRVLWGPCPLWTGETLSVSILQCLSPTAIQCMLVFTLFGLEAIGSYNSYNWNLVEFSFAVHDKIGLVWSYSYCFIYLFLTLASSPLEQFRSLRSPSSTRNDIFIFLMLWMTWTAFAILAIFWGCVIIFFVSSGK